MIFNYTKITRKTRHLVGDGVGLRRGAGDVVEPVSNSSILYDIAGMEDVRACGRDLNFNLITNTSGTGQQAHPRKQLRNILGRLAVR